MRLLTDENFNGAILRGLMRRLSQLDIVRVQDVGLLHADDPDFDEKVQAAIRQKLEAGRNNNRQRSNTSNAADG